MQTWDAITSRRNVRSFADRPIAAADLDQILEAGRRAPSSQNWQPWDFILVTEGIQAPPGEIYFGADPDLSVDAPVAAPDEPEEPQKKDQVPFGGTTPPNPPEKSDGWFEVSLIPETLKRTTMGAKQPGDEVNLEVDVIAKYVERLMKT